MTAGLVTLGETMALLTADAAGSLAHSDSFRLGIGGAESNVAIGVARLGVPATWIGRIGSDELGLRVRRSLRAEGVDARIVVDPSAPTGLMLKHARIPQRTRVMYYRAGSAGSQLSPEDVDDAVVASAGVLHVTGITPALSGSAAAAIDRAIDIATAAGVPVSFDVNHRSALWGEDRAASAYRSLADRAQIVFGGPEEAALIDAGTDPRELALRIADRGPTQVIIKLGARGCGALIDGDWLEVDAVRVTPVDTVGAGDAFVAGYLAELLSGAPVAARLDVATRAGAFACLGAGDWESLPTREDLSLLDAADPVQR